MSPEKLLALVNYTELRHRADLGIRFKENSMLVLFLSLPIIFHLKKTEATFPSAPSTHYPTLVS